MFRFFIQDSDRGEVRARSIIQSEVGLWVIAQVIDSTDPGDQFRAYANDDYSNKVGLICLNGESERHVTDRARSWDLG